MKYSIEVNGVKLSAAVTGDKLQLGDESLDATLHHVAPGQLSVLRIGRRVYRVAFARRKSQEGRDRRGLYSIWVNGERFEVDALDARRRAIEEATSSVAVRRVAELRAPMPGLIVTIRVAVGDSVVAGQGLIVMEAMKMENELRATSAGVVTKVHVSAGRPVEKGTVLLEVE